jgi:hypothetical protein
MTAPVYTNLASAYDQLLGPLAEDTWRRGILVEIGRLRWPPVAELSILVLDRYWVPTPSRRRCRRVPHWCIRITRDAGARVRLWVWASTAAAAAKWSP